jgi:hypothetical protein
LTPADERASRLFIAAVDAQVLLGLILYFAQDTPTRSTAVSRLL